MLVVFFLMRRLPPRSTLDRSSAASDVYKRQALESPNSSNSWVDYFLAFEMKLDELNGHILDIGSVSYTHLRAHETVLDLVCRLLLEKKKKSTQQDIISRPNRLFTG